MGTYELSAVKEMRHVIRADTTVTALYGHILELERATENSIRMTVVTGDEKWADKYKQYNATLYNAIKESSALMAMQHMQSNSSQLDSKREALNAKHAQAFHLFKQGNVTSAKAILFSPDYDLSKQNYVQAVGEFDKLLQAKRELHLRHKMAMTRYSETAIFVALIFLALAWWLMYKHSRWLKTVKWREQLLTVDMDDAQVAQALRTRQQDDLLTVEVQQALMKDEFVLYYQPIVNAHDGQIMGAEALLRWQHPERGLLTPDAFLTPCERNGSIVSLGAWVLSSACKQVKKWHEMGYDQLSISVNLSARQLNHPELLNLITDVLHSNQIDPVHLKLEMTESLVMENGASTMQLLDSLRKLGLQLSLDDFGTGYSSLSYLKQFPFNYLKIDKSFIADIATNLTSVAIVEAIISLGKNLGLTLIAEGIEDKTQLHVLKKMKCDLLQGYLYSKPVPAEQFNLLLASVANNKT